MDVFVTVGVPAGHNMDVGPHCSQLLPRRGEGLKIPDPNEPVHCHQQ